MNWYTSGIIAAILLGTYNFLYGLIPKTANIASVLVGIGIGIILFGLFLGSLNKKFPWDSSYQGLIPIAIGMVLGLAISFVVKSVSDPNVRIAQLIPLINTNTVISVVLALILLKEYQSAPLLKVALGTLLILLGGSIIR